MRPVAWPRSLTIASLCVQVALAFGGSVKTPDFSAHVGTQVLSASDLALNESGRLVFIGDIHGMHASLLSLLSRINFDPSHDTLVTAGDMLTKGGVTSSLAVLDVLMANGARPVRGNQDQPVIEWRAWQEWIEGLDEHARPVKGPKGSDPHKPLTGHRWLRGLDRSFAHRPSWLDRERWLATQRAQGPDHFWKFVPPDMFDDMFDQAYLIARKMDEDQAVWLRSTPSALHIPSLHTFVVHAGILPTNVTRPLHAASQPLAVTPPGQTEGEARWAQEASLLDGAGIPRNAELWTRTRLRSVRWNATLSSKREEGTYWADIWGSVVDKCQGFRAPPKGGKYLDDNSMQKQHLSCMPMTVVYAHTAAFGLDVRRWTIGLDSGCVYGRELSALVVDGRSTVTSVEDRKRLERMEVMSTTLDQRPLSPGSASNAVDDGRIAPAPKPRWVRFGDHGSAQLVQVRCSLKDADGVEGR